MRTKRDPVTSRFSQYEKAGSANPSVLVAQARFLDIAKVVEPRLLLALDDGPFQIFKLLKPHIKGSKAFPEPESVRLSAELDSALDEWLRRFNLNADWCRRWANAAMMDCVVEVEDEAGRSVSVFDLRSYSFYYSSGLGDYLADLAISDYKEFDPDLAPPDPPDPLPVYNPLSQTREDYTASVQRFINRKVETEPLFSLGERSLRNAFLHSIFEEAEGYSRSVEEYFASAPGWQKVKDKPMLLTHLNWAAEFQVGKKSWTEIARHRRENQDNVRTQVRRLLKEIGLAPRTDVKRGRPKGG